MLLLVVVIVMRLRELKTRVWEHLSSIERVLLSCLPAQINFVVEYMVV